MIESNAIGKNFIVCLCDNLIVGSVILNCLATHPSLRIWSLMLEQLRYSRALCLSRGTVMAESCYLSLSSQSRSFSKFCTSTTATQTSHKTLENGLTIVVKTFACSLRDVAMSSKRNKNSSVESSLSAPENLTMLDHVDHTEELVFIFYLLHTLKAPFY